MCLFQCVANDWSDLLIFILNINQTKILLNCPRPKLPIYDSMLKIGEVVEY